MIGSSKSLFIVSFALDNWNFLQYSGQNIAVKFKYYITIVISAIFCQKLVKDHTPLKPCQFNKRTLGSGMFHFS